MPHPRSSAFVPIAGDTPKRCGGNSFKDGVPRPGGPARPEGDGLPPQGKGAVGPTCPVAPGRAGWARRPRSPGGRSAKGQHPIDYRVTVLDPLGDKAAMTR